MVRVIRRTTAIAIICIAAFFLFGCSTDINIPNGYINEEEYFDKYGFQDHTDYCKYYYSDKTPFENHSRYHKVSESDIGTISGYFDDFQLWMEEEGRFDEYDFDINSISAGDYVVIKTMEGRKEPNIVYGKYDNYTVYFFDTDSCVLYYIHNNI